jgi:hypothetical protein
MDIATLAATVMGILMPWAMKGAKEFVDAAGEVAYDKTKALVARLKARWSGDKEAVAVIEGFEKKPERYQPVLEDVLKEKLAADKALAAELEDLLKELGPQLKIIQKMTWAENVVGLDAGEFNKGKAEVEQNIETAKNVTGAKLNRIG